MTPGQYRVVAVVADVVLVMIALWAVFNLLGEIGPSLF